MKHIVSTTCPCCNGTTQIEVPREGYLAWRNGELIQNALPTLTDDEREQLISGICPKCWEDTFGVEDDEGEPDPAEPYTPSEDSHIDQTRE